jgi:uncharacterized protein
LAQTERERRCIVTGDTPGEAALLRFALSPDGAVYPDPAAKAPGRGAWIRSDRAHIETAVKRGAFARAFKTQATAPADLSARAEAALAARCLSILGMGAKASALAVGFDQVEAAVRKKRPPALIEAVDGSADGREKLLKLAFALWNAPAPVSACFTAAEIAMALGRDRVIHACWLQERMARLWTAEIGRLGGFRVLIPETWGKASWLAAREAESPPA